jgi:SAM-dependent methyltransferase
VLRLGLYHQVGPILADCVGTKVLSISGAHGLVRLLPKRDHTTIVETSFPDVRMEDLPMDDETFDIVLSDQVLEHVADPWTAVQESLRVTKAGGLVVHTSCFMNPVHRDPSDFWRFTPEGLEALCAPHCVESVGAWGNRLAVILVLLGRRRLPNAPILGRATQALLRRNDPRCPLVVWVAARRMPTGLASHR